MRILIDAQPLLEPLAGIGRYAKSLLTAFSRMELQDEIHLFYGASMRPRRVELPEFSNPGLNPRIIRFPGKIYRLLTEKLKLMPPSSFTGRFDLYHGLNYYVPPSGGPKIVNIYDMSFKLYPQYFTPERLRDIGRKAAASAGRADRIITGSESAKEDIVSLLGVPAEKVSVIANGVEKSFRVIGEKEREEFRAGRNLPEKFILFVGTVEPRKNLTALLKAFHKMGLRDTGLVIAGGRGWLYEELFDVLKGLNLGERVIFTGYLPDEDLPKIYSCASVFAYPSVYEGFGFPPLEAMACGVPVVTGNRSSLPEITGGAGICVDPEDSDALADALSGVINDGVLRKSMVEKGLSRAAGYTWEKCADETYGVYREFA